MEHSIYQKEIFKEINSGTDNLAIIARAGCAKTFSIIEGLKYVPKGKTVLCTAFNKAIADELKKRAPTYVDCQTFHSTGFRAIKNKFGAVEVDEYKTRGILEKILEVKYYECIPELLRTISLCKGSLKDSPDEVMNIVNKYSIDFYPMEEEYFVKKVIGTLGICKQNKSTIDYDDMTWYPFVYNMYIGKWDYIFVDEFQDLNNAQIYITKLASKQNSRLFFFGDPRQRIFSFTGANAESIEDTFEKLSVKRLPLPMTYRCPKSIVKLANEIVPDFICPDDAIEGSIKFINYNQILENIRPGSYFLSRYNAPLIKYCMMFIKHNKPANIQGKDIGTNLISFIKKSRSKTIIDLGKYLLKWKEKETKRLSDLNKPIDDVLDKFECLNNLIEESETLTQLKQLINKMFVEINSDDVIICSTIHRIKGKQAKDVFILRNTLNKGSSEEEDNIYYVGITRASENLFFIDKNIEVNV